MQLYLMRHGIALDVGEQGIKRDAERPLSPEGIHKTTAIAAGLAALEIRLDAIGTSPLIRARQTAQIVAEAIGRRATFEECPALAPGGAPEDVFAWLRSHAVEAVLLTGHMPDLADLASVCLSGRESVNLVFKKAGVCCIAFEGAPAKSQGQLEWLMQPRHLVALGTR